MIDFCLNFIILHSVEFIVIMIICLILSFILSEMEIFNVITDISLYIGVTILAVMITIFSLTMSYNSSQELPRETISVEQMELHYSEEIRVKIVDSYRMSVVTDRAEYFADRVVFTNNVNNILLVKQEVKHTSFVGKLIYAQFDASNYKKQYRTEIFIPKKLDIETEMEYTNSIEQ